MLAMAHHQLGQLDDARREFEAAVAWIEKAKSLPRINDPHKYGLHTNDWLSMLVLRAETAKVLGIEDP